MIYDKAEAERLIASVPADDEPWDCEAHDAGEECDSSDYVDGHNDAIKAYARPLAKQLKSASYRIRELEDALSDALAYTIPGPERDRLVAILAGRADLACQPAIAASDLHASCSHPDYEYETTTGPRKNFNMHAPLGGAGSGWVRNTERGINGWERFDHHEEAYWMRRKVKS